MKKHTHRWWQSQQITVKREEDRAGVQSRKSTAVLSNGGRCSDSFPEVTNEIVMRFTLARCRLIQTRRRDGVCVCVFAC